ncbi:glycosyl hydrolase [Siansivirga zeaxanthinifaciens]|uniref:glucan endo-1,3-beta-D-glucosidase n=1 Tax=Siansivirga zeaxanthinifaciens CC-SAMT-1 TaxID=1454006 RepID=A0A0C5W9D5_9FLAO|nr:glycosyl hydrolase [Siansivirga zeaxanthinifaciens]AJR02902.1 endo-1,3(4)-beta-glucanase [Siansivirga zeaxanthinifaciens CC-SAMT-1]
MRRKLNLKTLLVIAFISLTLNINAQVPAGSGSYTTTYPGADSAGRNSFPSGTPQLSGAAVGKPVPTNDWWSKLVKENHADNLFNYPMTMKTTNTGLVVTYIPFGVIGDSAPIQVGLSGLNTTKTTVSDYSDWTVTMNWSDASHSLSATSGIGMPFLYFEKDSDDILEIKVNGGTATMSSELLIIENASGVADFVFYAPTGSTWTQNGSTYSSTLNNKTYWSMAMLPQSTSNLAAVANEYKKYAYVFPTNTTTAWNYDESTSKVLTTFTVSTQAKEGTETNVLLGLLPHQWANLALGSPAPDKYSYSGIRGEIKTMDGNTFSVENTFKGILPTMPYLANYSAGFDPSKLDAKISQIENDGLSTWTDSYNEGQVMNRLIQTARIADQIGNIVARDKMIATVKERLEDWLTYQSGEVAFLFYYNSAWSAMLGYPAGHGQDSNINDHHFHWGYFIHAAAFMEQFEPGWSAQWGDMINLLVRDAASDNRNDALFPFLRNFSPYAGHCWANGFASFPQGNDQESTSESMQFNSSLIHWGTITGNDAIRDLGIYLYTTEQTAVEEYWFDMNERNFQPSQQYSLVSRVWGNSYDNGTFWTGDITASYGIELYPIHGGSLYLGQNKAYVQKIWDELKTYTEIQSTSSTNPNLWHDTFWKYLSFIDPQAAIDMYDAYPDRILKFGISDAQTYHWLHAMNALGTLEATLTANYPIAAAFNNNGDMTYVAHNYSNSPITVTFSDGYTLDVPANHMATSKDANVSGTMASDFNQAFPNGSVNLIVTTVDSGVTKVEFYDGTTLLGEDTTAPYQFKATNLALGKHGMYAKVFESSQFNVTNIVTIQVGEQVPYSGTPIEIPGIIEPGNYDTFEGGIGQNISYVDVSQNNEGDFRTDQYVDATTDTNEGNIVGWISAGEWVEYTIDVQTAGNYDVLFRYASGNSNGGGPFHFEVEGNTISPDISVTATSTSNWTTWATATASNIELNEGIQVLRLFFTNGEFNLGKLTFTYNSPLAYNPPVANAGSNVVVVLPETTGSLDGSLSTDADTPTLNYTWEQIYGPSVISFSDNTAVQPTISNLEEGIYKCKLTVSDGSHESSSTVLVIVSATGNTNPVTNITSPTNDASFKQNTDILIMASASDLDGTVSLVEFFDGATKIGEDTTAPFSYLWSGASLGNHELTTKATDNDGATSTSPIVNIIVQQTKVCTETSSEAQQGSFSIGYKSTFETIGTNVIVTFELLDTDKTGVVAYLWQQTPFAESSMDQVSGNIFTKTLSGLTAGTTINYACKFAYAGGLSATKYLSYVVDTDCSGSGDVQAPASFTATLGAVTGTSVELLLNATDDSGSVIYEVTYGSNNTSTTGISGTQKSFVIAALTPNTDYTFSVSARDLAGNMAANNPITINTTTLSSSNSNCSGTSSDAQQGSFSVGYNYSFSTSGTDVTFTFELLDDKTGINAYLWKQTPFGETPMTNTSGKIFKATITGQTPGATISYACKFAFPSGLAVTKYFSYVVGDACALSTDDTLWKDDFTVYPNPTETNWTFKTKNINIQTIEVFDVLGKRVLSINPDTDKVSVEAKSLKSGLYFAKVKTEAGIDTIKLVKR